MIFIESDFLNTPMTALNYNLYDYKCFKTLVAAYSKMKMLNRLSNNMALSYYF